MDEGFKIYIEQLKDGHEETINELFDPSFLRIDEKELQFREPVSVQGRAYIANEDLVLELNAETTCFMPCLVCNEMVPVSIKLNNCMLVEPKESIKSGVFRYNNFLRESLLLEIPQFIECNNENCPKRSEMNKFLKKNKQKGEGTFYPFANL